jgi:hypothetical protein
MKAVLLGVLVAVAAQAASVDYPPAFPRPGITKVLENERVIIWQGLHGALGIPTDLHRHVYDVVGVFLDDGRIRAILPDGTVRDGNPFTRGHAVFSPKGIVHVEEGLMDGTRVVGIELKDRPVQEATNDAISTVESQVRVDNASVVIRDHTWGVVPARRDGRGRDVVLIPFQSGIVRRVKPDGSSETQRLVFGEVIYRPHEAMQIESVLAGRPRAIVVELK